VNFNITVNFQGASFQNYTVTVTGTSAIATSDVHTATATLTLQPLILRPTIFTQAPFTGINGNYINAANAFDGNPSTFAAGCFNTACGTIWSGFGADSGTITAITLKVTSQASVTAIGGQTFVEYSLDGGSTWITIYSLASFGSHPLLTDAVSLPLTQNFANVQVQGWFNSSATSQINEIWIEVSH